VFRKVDEVRCLIDASQELILQLNDCMTVRAKDYKFDPKYQSGKWDGFIHFIDYATDTIPNGLVHKACEYLDMWGVSYDASEINTQEFDYST